MKETGSRVSKGGCQDRKKRTDDGKDDQEVSVAEELGEDVEATVETTAVELVEDLAENEAGKGRNRDRRQSIIEGKIERIRKRKMRLTC